jgi:hypothetical protein
MRLRLILPFAGFVAMLAVVPARSVPAIVGSVLTADLTFDTHMYVFQDVATPYFGAGMSAALREEVPLSGNASLYSETGLVTGVAFSGRAAGFRSVLVPIYSSFTMGIDADRRFQGWAALRIGVTGNAVSGWGIEFPWSVGLALGVATRVAGSVMATVELSTISTYAGGIAARLVSSRAGVRYAPSESRR